MSRLPLALRYLVIAGVCFLASNLTVIVGDQFGLPIPLAVTVAFVVVGALGFFLHCRFTFKAVPSWISFARFLLATAANLPLSTLWLWLFASLIGLPMIVAAPLSSACMLLVNFLGSRWAILSGRGTVLIPERP